MNLSSACIGVADAGLFSLSRIACSAVSFIQLHNLKALSPRWINPPDLAECLRRSPADLYTAPKLRLPYNVRLTLKPSRQVQGHSPRKRCWSIRSLTSSSQSSVLNEAHPKLRIASYAQNTRSVLRAVGPTGRFTTMLMSSPHLTTSGPGSRSTLHSTERMVRLWAYGLDIFPLLS